VSSVDDLLSELGLETLSSRELQRRLGASQATVSRLLRAAGAQVVRLGRGPATRYAAARPVFGSGLRLPLYAVDEAGVVGELAVLRALADGRYLVEAHEPAFWLLGEGGHGLFGSLPYFLHDLRPSGFLGRALARQLAAEWGTPRDPREWSDDQIGGFLIRRGDDLPGNLVVGEAAAARAREGTTTPAVDLDEYPRLAERALGDDAPGSSAAGEQPKFAVRRHRAGHVIVKFSPATASEEGERWRDLLRSEHRALELLRERGHPAAETSIHLLEGRVFLESRRFDRRGVDGRVGAISLAMVDAELVGAGHGWTRVARGLRERGLLDSRSCEQLEWLESFGEWIGNSDMHLGNVSLSPGPRGFGLLPIYDMLPMALAPIRGELPNASPRPPLRGVGAAAVWSSAGEAALDYWQRLTEDEQLSTGFRALARDRRLAIARALGG
jgi:hypothetical protein